MDLGRVELIFIASSKTFNLREEKKACNTSQKYTFTLPAIVSNIGKACNTKLVGYQNQPEKGGQRDGTRNICTAKQTYGK